MQSGGDHSSDLAADSKKKTAITMQSRLLQLRRQQLSHHRQQEVSMRNLKSCLTRPCLFREAQLRWDVVSRPGGKHHPTRLSMSCVDGAAASEPSRLCHASSKRGRETPDLQAGGKRKPARHEEQHKSMPENKPVSRRDTSINDTPERRGAGDQQFASQIGRGPHQTNGCQQQGYDFDRRCRTYYSLLGVKASADFQEIRKAFLRLATRWHPDKRGDANAANFLNLRQAYDVLKHPESRRAYDIQIACRRLISLSPTKEAASLGGTRSDTTALCRTASVPPDNFSSLEAGAWCVLSPTLSLPESSEGEDDSTPFYDTAYPTSSRDSLTETPQIRKNSARKASYYGHFSAGKVQTAKTNEFRNILDAQAKLRRVTSPVRLRVTSWSGSSVKARDKHSQNNMNNTSAYATNHRSRRSPSWAGTYFSVLWELFFKPILPSYNDQKYSRLRCPRKLCKRLQSLLKHMSRLRYHRRFFIQPFCVDPRCGGSSAGGGPAGTELVSLKRCAPERKAACSPSNDKSCAGSLTLPNWCPISGQDESNRVRRLLQKNGGVCSVACNHYEDDSLRERSSTPRVQTEHPRCRATHITIEGPSQTRKRGTDESEGRTAVCTWWVTALREQLCAGLSDQGNGYRYVQLVPPPPQHDTEFCKMDTMSTASLGPRSSVVSPLVGTKSSTLDTVPENLNKHLYFEDVYFEKELKRRSAELTGPLKVTHKKCGSENPFLPVWGIVFFKNRQAIDELESTVDGILNTLSPETPANRCIGGSDLEWSRTPAWKRGASGVCGAFRDHNSAAGRYDEKDASLCRELNARHYGTCPIFGGPSVIQSNRATPQKMPRITVTHLTTCVLRRLTLCDCLVLLTAPPDRFAENSLQRFSCHVTSGNACSFEDIHVPFTARRHTLEPSINDAGTRLQTRGTTNSFFHALTADESLDKITTERLHSTCGSIPTTAGTWITEEDQNQQSPSASFEVRGAGAFLPVWLVTILQSQHGCGENWRAQSPFVACSLNGAYYSVMHPQEATLRWLSHTLIKLCAHAAAEV